jgi:hypothetical protein
MKYRIFSLSFFFIFNNSLIAQELMHKLYGYSQLDYKASNDPNLPEGFHLTRMNLINDFNLQENARFVIDVEYEDGTDLSSTKTSKGSLKVSRGFFEYNFKNNSSLNFGKILTPFGLYNETHDFTITYLPIEVPLPYRAFIPLSAGATRIFSKYSTGISYKDTTKNFDKFIWQNQFTILNGVRETQIGTDSNHDKGLSLKSSLKHLEGDNVYESGFSLYTEKDSSVFEGNGNKRFWTAALHFKFENNSYNFTTEVFHSQFNSANKDIQKALAYYACLGYTVNEHFIPYVLYTKAYRDLSNKKNSDKDIIVGVNSNLLPQVVLKIEYTKTEREVLEEDKNFQTIATDLAIAF